MKRIYYTLFCMYLLLLNLACFAQTSEVDKPGMAVGMRANGKIYVVVAVIVTIFLGLIVYLVNLEKKITRLEKDIRPNSGK